MKFWLRECQKICGAEGVSLIVNHFRETAAKLQIGRLHLSMAAFKALAGHPEGFDGWEQIGVSVHSREEAVYAESKGADYLIAGHIFATDCKKGLPPRGLDFLAEICASVKIPVFAIGGMDLVPRASGAGGGSCRNMHDVGTDEVRGTGENHTKIFWTVSLKNGTIKITI